MGRTDRCPGLLRRQERQRRDAAGRSVQLLHRLAERRSRTRRNKWQTFLTRELPPVIDAQFGTNGVNSIAAISMTATSVLNLAISAPGLYRSVGAYSGCAETSTQPGQDYVRLVVGARGGADPTNMWGPFDGPGWRENDPVVNAEKLRGTALYVSTGSGLPGPHDNLQAPDVNGNPGALLNQIVVGGIIESAVNGCTHGLADRLNSLGIPATFDFKPTGTHSWGYWQDDLHNSWPMLAGRWERSSRSGVLTSETARASTSFGRATVTIGTGLPSPSPSRTRPADRTGRTAEPRPVDRRTCRRMSRPLPNRG